MRILVVGASRGLGRAVVDGLAGDGHDVTGVSRTRPAVVEAQWIEADFGVPGRAAESIADQAPDELDVIIYNLGIWEATAFTDDYSFLAQSAEATEALVAANVTGPLLVLHRLLPRLLDSAQPKIILTGSTSGLPRSGRPEVAVGASKNALNGIADALRENYREQRLAVTVLQLGYLNTDDPLHTPKARAAEAGRGTQIPVHDVLDVIRMLLGLSPASFVRELVMPAILDERF